MNRRKFLGLGIGALGLALAKSAQAQDSLKNPLRSYPDLDTTFDEDRAEKTRKLVKYIIEKKEQKDLLKYEDLSESYSKSYPSELELQVVRVELYIKGQDYWITVYNYGDNSLSTDKIEMYIMPYGRQNLDSNIYLRDTGLDGRCDLGTTSASLNKTSKEIKFIHPQKGILELKGEGIEHQEKFQEIYDKTIDNLLSFYETK